MTLILNDFVRSCGLGIWIRIQNIFERFRIIEKYAGVTF